MLFSSLAKLLTEKYPGSSCEVRLDLSLIHISVASVCEKTVVIGDAVSAGTMADATRAAYEKCFYI